MKLNKVQKYFLSKFNNDLNDEEFSELKKVIYDWEQYTDTFNDFKMTAELSLKNRNII